MIKLIVLFLTIAGVIFFFYMGFHQSVEVNDITMPSKVLLYKEYKGDYKKIGIAFDKLEKELAKLGTKKYQEFAMYYDDPALIEDPNQSRAVVGVLLDPEHRNHAINFLVDNANYRINEYSRIHGLSVTFPYRNELSLAWVIARIYPAMINYGKEKGIFAKGHKVGSLEIYHYKNGESTIEVVFPYGKEAEKLVLNKSPFPKYRKGGSDL